MADSITLGNGICLPLDKILKPINLGKEIAESRVRYSKEPTPPFCFTSFKQFNLFQSKLPFKLWKLKKDFLSRNKNIKQIKKTIQSDSVLKNYFKEIKEENIYNKTKADSTRVFYPDLLSDYLAHQQNLSGQTIQEVFKYKENLEIISEEIGIKKPKETITCLLYDDMLRNMFLEDDILNKIKKKDKIEPLSEISGTAKSKIIKNVRELKNKYIKQILKYKQENNLLTYTDLEKFERISPKRSLIKRINDKYYSGDKTNYSKIARQFGLKDGRVTKKTVSTIPLCYLNNN